MFLFPAPVLVTFDDLLVRPVRRLVAPDMSFPGVVRSDPAMTPLLRAIPAAVVPTPPASLPVPIATGPYGVAVRTRRGPLVTGARGRRAGNANLESRRRGLREGWSPAEDREYGRRDRCQDSSKHGTSAPQRCEASFKAHGVFAVIFRRGTPGRKTRALPGLAPIAPPASASASASD